MEVIGGYSVRIAYSFPLLDLLFAFERCTNLSDSIYSIQLDTRLTHQKARGDVFFEMGKISNTGIQLVRAAAKLQFLATRFDVIFNTLTLVNHLLVFVNRGKSLSPCSCYLPGLPQTFQPKGKHGSVFQS